jgi:hypothetical protein
MAASIKDMVDFEDVIPTDKKSKMLNRELVSDMVNHPPHYNQTGIECIDAIKACTEDGFQFYLQGNILKYLWRYRYKNGLEDLKKAKWYLSELIKAIETNDNAKNKS